MASNGYGSIRDDHHTVTKSKSNRGQIRVKRGKRIGTPTTIPGNPPVDPNQALIDAMVRLRYGGEDLALAQQRNNINAWFPQYQQRVADAAKASQAFYAGLQQGNLQAQANAAQGPDLGPGVSADVQAQSKLAGASRASMQGQFGQALGAASGAENSFLLNQGIVGQAAQLGQQIGNQQAMQQLQAQKGQYAIQAKADIEADIAKRKLEEQVFGLDTQKEQNKVAIAAQNSKDKASQRKATARNQRAARIQRAKEKGQEVNKYGYSNEQWQRFSPSHRQRIISQEGKQSGGSSLTPKEAREARVNFRRAVADVKRNPGLASDSLYDQMVQAGYDPVVARAAVQLVRKGHVGPNTSRSLERDYGIKAPRGKKHPVAARQDTPISKGPNGQMRPN